MSPASHRSPIGANAAQALTRLAAGAGQTLRDERLRRDWSLRELARRAGISAAQIQDVEAGNPASLETYARVATALDLRPDLTAIDPRKRSGRVARAEDPVHAAMGEVDARRLRGHLFAVSLDEPYQHFQFAGRADLLSWDLERRALLHVENRTRFPNIQEALGSFNAKRAYMPAVLAQRLGIERAGWASVSHVLAVLWSAEALHSVRLHLETFRSVCPDPATDFEGWWRGEPPSPGRVSSALVLFDPNAGRRRAFARLDEIAGLRGRYRGYAEAAAALRLSSDADITFGVPVSR